MREVFTENTNDEKELTVGKYQWLLQNDIRTTEWTELKPQSPFYLFTPQNKDLLAEYETGWKVTEMMPVNVLGFQTHRDHFAIDFDRKELEKRIKDLREAKLTDKDIRESYDITDNRDWQLLIARKDLRQNNKWRDDLISCTYRPFDNRFCYFSTVAMDYPRRELLDHVAGKDNLCLGLGRQGIAVNDPEWSLISTSRYPVDANIFRRGGINLFPLYLYPTEKKSLFDDDFSDGRKPNLSPEFIADFSSRVNLEFIAEGEDKIGNRQSAIASLPKTFSLTPTLSFIRLNIECATLSF